MAERFFRYWGHRYLLMVMVLTRLFGSIGGMGVIYYVELTLNLPSPLREHFRLYSAIVVVVSCSLTVLVAIWETRTLTRVLKLFADGQTVEHAEGTRAGYEAATFVKRHHWFEAWFVPCSTLVPDMLCLKYLDSASSTILTNLTVTVFMGIAMALMSTYFTLEHAMKPVLRYLLDRGVNIDYARLPAGRLRLRFGVSFALIIMTTALMIGTLARQRATDIIADPENQAAAVQNLRVHSLGITVAAVVIGIMYSTLLTDSVATRAGQIITAMSRVAKGQLSERLTPTGNDEIDVLARHFNTMVRELEHNDHTIRDLNLNLQERVRERTAQLEETIQQLRETQSQLTDVAHRAGMAEVATGVLHNVGNVLNNVNTSVALLSDLIRRSKLGELQAFAARLEQRGAELPAFLATERRAEKLLDFLKHCAARLAAEQDEVLRETRGLREKVDHIKGIINAQQAYARQLPFRETVDVGQLVSDVLKMHAATLSKYRIAVDLQVQDALAISVEKSKLMQVIDNLVKNAAESITESDSKQRVIQVTVGEKEGREGRIAVTDSGGGIAPEQFDQIFRYGFTTKATGNGFGLHSSALAMSSLGGRIYAESPGVGRGATFVVEFPLSDVSSPVEVGSGEVGEPLAAGA